ncbi:MAG: hypothetical protein KGY40_08450 [Thioalkalivibrio sp.]|nr:hypothetical protein [Thioalkalivibrio sp.]
MAEQPREEQRKEEEELHQRRENMQRRSDGQAAAGFDVIQERPDSVDGTTEDHSGA